MRDKWVLLAIFALLICMGTVGYAVQRVSGARAVLRSTESQRSLLSGRVNEYQRLTAKQADTIFGTQPKADFEKRLSQVVQESGLGHRARYSLQLAADREYRDQRGQPTGLRQQRASVEFQQLSLIQIGMFLTEWYETQSLWQPEMINLTHNQRSDDSVYTLRLECVAVYHGQESE